LAAVVDRDRVPDHLREDRRGARPGLQHALGAGRVHLLHPRQQAGVHERPLLRATTHLLPTSLPALATAHDVAGAGLLGVARTAAERDLAPWRDGVAAALGLALATAVRVVDRVHGGAAHGRALALPARATGLAAGLVGVRDVRELPDRGAAL